MTRYTIETEGCHEGFRIEPIKEVLEKHLIRQVATYKIRAVTQIQLTGIILINTDASLSKLLELFNTLKDGAFSIRHISVRFGWDVPASFESIIHLKDEEKDPHFYLVKVQPEIEMIYTYSKSGWISFIVSYIILFVIGALIQDMSVLPILIFIGLFAFAYSLFSNILSIRCNELGIDFRSLLGPKTIITWSEIRSLTIVLRRGEWCIIQRNGGKTQFPLSGNYTNEKMLIKTMIEKANLHFMGLSSDITYRRAENIYKS